jgi:hypothetical protein
MVLRSQIDSDEYVNSNWIESGVWPVESARLVPACHNAHVRGDHAAVIHDILEE